MRALGTTLGVDGLPETFVAAWEGSHVEQDGVRVGGGGCLFVMVLFIRSFLSERPCRQEHL